MARKKITPEEEVPKTVAPEESAAADVGDMTQNDLPPGDGGTAEGCGAEAVPTTELAEDAGGASVGNDPPKENRVDALAETVSAQMPAADISAEEEAVPTPMLPRWRACWTPAAKMRRGLRPKEMPTA